MSDVFEDIANEAIIRFGDGDTVTLARAIEGWENSLDTVRRGVEGDPQLTLEVYNEHDYVGMLYWRDIIERCVAKLEESKATVVRQSLTKFDGEFSNLTESGFFDKVDVIAFGDTGSNSWWWDRIPKSGLVRDEFDMISEIDD